MHGKRIAELDILRGVAIFGVLILHSSFQSRFTPETLEVQAILAKLFDWSVLAFFYSSGCLHDSSVPFVVTVKKRFISLLVPFFLYNALYNLCFAGVEAMGWMPNGVFEINSRLLATGLFQSPAFQLYFLPYLFVISTGICGLDKLSRRHHGWTYGVILCLIALFYLDRGYPKISYGPAYDHLPLYIAAFLIGILSRPFLERPFAKLWIIVAALGGVLLISVLWQPSIMSLSVPPLMIGAARIIRESRLLLCMGKMSGSIYLWHTPVMLPAFTRLLAYCGIPSLFNLFGSIVLTLTICILIRRGLDTFFEQTLKRQTPRYITL
jgi:peptidoglycan/LPS O-acetylase OafA/YrhL